MILNTGCRTDIPAYYSEWFYTRVREGFVLARNPYRPEQVLSYRLNPDVVDVLCFCTKNPQPMLSRLSELNAFRQFWFVTVTPYGQDIEPFVPDKRQVLASIRRLSASVGAKAVGWRYDPVFITERYSLEFHIRSFEKMARELSGTVTACVVSFIDLYEKTRRNFPQARAVTTREQEALIQAFVEIGARYRIPMRTCCEDASLARFGADTSGCMTRSVLEAATGCRLNVPKSKKSPRAQCDCLLGADVGMYNTCPHGCVYCYANSDRRAVEQNRRQHDPTSPLLIGHLREDDQLVDARQESYLSEQISMF